ncbi:MAG: YggS family pyridoxal phosphate-dependent enzyme [Gammaproteobacteria bacterium]|nr:YggS family pyridoxal phosphate-dependent enzyme [Gammaproteobacteria bacterium]
MDDIEQNIKTVLHSIREYETRYHRTPLSVTLLAVSKGQPIEKITQALDAGQTHFGENYLQEALDKIAILANPAIEWHFIGAIQSNKTKLISENFHWVQSVSDIRIATRLNDQRPNHLPPLNICLQVNISEEPTKSGMPIGEVDAFIEKCHKLPRLRLRGLMAIPAPKNIFREQRAECQKLRLLFENLLEKYDFLDTLSMGMSDDMEAAISEGATMIRIGTKIFGFR